ncbi:MAG: ABC transporter permease [Candidatus Hinthialibacter antarcticus]|nr:ABC transporter permease [Candidatus Hinthialibacter antarcticus]
MIIQAFFLRPVRRRPVRFLLTALGVAIGAASVVATVLACQAAVRSMEEDIKELAGRTKLEISRPGDLDEQLLGEIRHFARDAVFAPVLDERVLVPQLDDLVRFFGLDLLSDDLVRGLDWDEGEAFGEEQFTQLLRGEGVMLPTPLAKQLAIRVGDSIELSLRSERIKVPVAGVFSPPSGTSAWDRVIVADIAYAQQLFGRAGRIDRIELMPRRGVPVDALRASLREALPNEYRIEQPDDRANQTNRMVSALRFNLTALSGISLLVGGVLVATTLYTSIVQRRYWIAMLRSLGASKSQLAFAVLAEAAAIGVVGGLLGALGGFAGAQVALASVRATMSVLVRDAPQSEIVWQPWLLWLGVGLGAVTSMASAFGPLLEAWKTPPLQALNSERPEYRNAKSYQKPMLLAAGFIVATVALSLAPPIYDLPYAALGASLAILAALIVLMGPLLDASAALAHRFRRGPFASTMQLAFAGLIAGRNRAAWAAGAIGVSVALAVGMSIMVTSFRQTIVDWTEQGLRSDIWIRSVSSQTGLPSGRLSPEALSIVHTLFDADQIDAFHMGEAFIQGEKIIFAAGEFSIVQKRGGVPFRGGRDSKDVFAETLQTHGAIVNEAFSRKFGVGEGDVVELQTRGGLIQRRVVGVYYDYSSHEGTLIIDRNDFLELHPDDGPQGIALFLPPDANLPAARERLREAFAGRWFIEIFLNRELKQEILKIFERTFAITAALQAIASLVAAIAVVMVLFALVNERKQDLSLLRILGAARWQTAKLVLWKAGILGAIGGAGGLAAGAVIGVILVKVVNLQSFRWSLQLIWPVGDLLMLYGVVVAACALAGAVPAWVVAKRNLQSVICDDA